MTKNSKSTLLASIAMISASIPYINPYDDLLNEYRPIAKNSPKTILTNKQKKARAKSKRAKIARRRNR